MSGKGGNIAPKQHASQGMKLYISKSMLHVIIMKKNQKVSVIDTNFGQNGSKMQSERFLISKNWGGGGGMPPDRPKEGGVLQ